MAFLQVISENGTKKYKFFTADAGSGAPVGTIIALYKKSNPANYLYLDGRDTTGTADELQTRYPPLYAYLGNTNVLPDYREFALVGAEQNTTDTIADHDVYTQGQGKDDQLQQHGHWSNPETGNLTTALGQNGNGGYSTGTNVAGARAGTVTRGKRKAVYFYIKATSGLTEGQQDDVANIINEQRSYSTTEHKTGKKWIDGKDVWSTVITGITVTTNWTQITNNISVETLVSINDVLTNGQISSTFERKVDNHNVYVAKPSAVTVESTTFILEYTKTTD